jgi:multicomponent Na+:H+ antiporter subunit F
MHVPLLYFAIGWTAILLLICAVIVIRGRSLLIRVLALDAFTLIQVALLVLVSHLTGAVAYLDAALALALLAFVGTVAASRYIGEGRLFS